ncbi:MAG: hypothetical protein CM15mP58_19030 [Burkholderiaceae bacterium]|nr:MAG: hypothetical protein CM15mP58_19030 [Burkholderiaceae bacterium]
MEGESSGSLKQMGEMELLKKNFNSMIKKLKISKINYYKNERHEAWETE